jgi:hypothetical protein
MSAVSDSKHVVLIHGTWFNGDIFGDARREFEARGYAVHTRHAGLVAATPAPAAGIFATYPGTIRVFSGHYLQRRPWTELLYPTTWKTFRRYVTITTDERLARDRYSVLVCESGRAYCEMGTGSSTAIGLPGSTSRRSPPPCSRSAHDGTGWCIAASIPASDHLVFHGNALPVTMSRIDEWMAEHRILTAG